MSVFLLKLGGEGVMDIVELNITDEERAALHASAKVVTDNFKAILANLNRYLNLCIHPSHVIAKLQRS